MRFGGELLERIIMPELNFDAAVETAPFFSIVGGHRELRALAGRADLVVAQPQRILHRQRHAARPRFRQPQLVAVDARSRFIQRQVVGVTHKMHHHIFLVAEVFQHFLDLADKCLRNIHLARLQAQRLHQVFQTCALGAARTITQLAHGFGAADLDAIQPFAFHHHFLVDRGFGDFIIPHLYFHAAIEAFAFRRIIAGNRFGVAHAVIADRLRLQIERAHEKFGGDGGARARQTKVVAILRAQTRPQSVAVGVPHKMHPHIGAILQLVQHIPQFGHCRFGNVRLAGTEANRRHRVFQLEGFDALVQHFLDFNAVFLARFKEGFILHPQVEHFIRRQLFFGVFTQRVRAQRARRLRHLAFGRIVKTEFGLRGETAKQANRCQGKHSDHTQWAVYVIASISEAIP